MPGPAPDYAQETAAGAWQGRRVAGVDEVGRGPLAGPVVAAAVVLDPRAIPDGLRDSKTLDARRRFALADALHASAEVGIGTASVAEIDALNILRASHLAMVRAVEALAVAPDLALVDGNRLPDRLGVPARAIVRGDALVLSIAAASIVAKVSRDATMAELALGYPGYGWERNAGYGTKKHLAALCSLGPTPHHRRSFRPVHNILCRDHQTTP